ncbi:MAG: glycosyltransferase family 4 protein, partial [Candidatus Aminicenantes bacterium]|nr:glycosyltransferase family 4 protein [Candidatus Aminicenantes bacterium]
MSRAKVLLVVDRAFLGGGQRTVLNLARGLDKDLFEVAVACEKEGPLVEQLGRDGIPRLALEMTKSPLSSAAKSLATTLAGEGFDLVHTHGGVAGLHGRRAAATAGIPAVHTLHGLHFLHYRNPILKRAAIRLERRLAFLSAAVVVVSEADRAKALALGLAPEEKLVLIRNGVEPFTPSADFDPAATRRELGLGSGPVIMAVSRLHRQKGLVHLIRAAALVQTLRPETQFAVVGGGPLRDDLEKEARRWGLGGAFRILGERPDAREILAAGDIFVLPSLWEGLPYVLVEAAALGKPIVATAIGGVLEVIEDGKTGLLIPPADPQRLAEALVRLLL